MSAPNRLTLIVFAVFAFMARTLAQGAVDMMVGSHGGTGTYADFLKAGVAPASSN